MTGSAKQSMARKKESMDCFVAALLAMTRGKRFATTLSPSLRANGSRERAPDDRLREAIHGAQKRRMDCFVATLLAMTKDERTYSTFAGIGCSLAEFATRAAFAMPARAASFFCGSEPGCTTPADMIKVAASSAVISTSMILLLGT